MEMKGIMQSVKWEEGLGKTGFVIIQGCTGGYMKSSMGEACERVNNVDDKWREAEVSVGG